jgi:hypothetical protein
MKKSLLLLSLMVSLGINSQIVNIPDTNFKAKLLSSSPSNTVAKDLNGNYFAIDANGDGEIQVGEASSVSELNVSNTNIVTLWGIAEFGHITSLNASGTLITSYDNYDSYNLYFLWNLKKLNLKNCINLQTFSHQINNGQTSTILEELNLENCSSLQSIEVSNGNLSYLNIKNCFNLTALWAEKNKLNFIESSNNLNLKKIFLYHNYFNSFNIEAP